MVRELSQKVKETITDVNNVTLILGSQPAVKGSNALGLAGRSANNDPTGVPPPPSVPLIDDVPVALFSLDLEFENYIGTLPQDLQDFLNDFNNADLGNIRSTIQTFLQDNNYSDQAKDAATIYIRTAINNLLTTAYNDDFLNSVYCCNSPILITSPTLGAQYARYVETQVAIIKSEYPPDYEFNNWELAKIYMEANLDAIQIGLDIIGLIPVLGEVADIANGVIYTINGDGVNATLSFAAAIPFAGWTANGAKIGYKLIASTINTQVRLTWRVLSNGSVYFGSSGSKLRKVLGITDSALHAHHLIPWALREHELVQKAAKSGSVFHINEALNGIPRPSGLHLTGHGHYNDVVEEILEEFKEEIDGIDEAYDFVSGLANHISDLITNNPTLNSGQVADLINYP